MLNEIDVANAIRAFAYFNHVDFKTMESLIKVTIKNCSEYKLQSLAVISNSMAQLGIQNKTFFEIVKTVLIK